MKRSVWFLIAVAGCGSAVREGQDARVAPQAARLVSPAPCSRITGPQPRFVLTGAGDVQVCRDRGCAAPIPANDLPPGIVFVRVGGVTSELRVVGRAPLASSWGAELDADGDGVTDTLVGSPLVESAFWYRGRASEPVRLRPPTGEDHYFGGSVAAAGDIDGDGYCDLAVGAPGFDGHGRVLLFPGGPDGPTRAPFVVDAPDLDAERFGDRVAAAGDVNGDGFGDVLVGDFQARAGEGRAHVLMGDAHRPGGRIITLATGHPDRFGQTVAGVGDVDGDGLADVVVGAPGDADGGRAYLYFGMRTGLSLPIELAHPDPGGTLRGDLAAVGDVDGDGLPDFAVGDREGGVVLFRGPGARTPGADVHVAARAIAALASPRPAPVGATVAAAGDLDGDGTGDLLVGTPDAGGFAGAIVLFRGGSLEAITLPGPAPGEARFGFAVGTPGDHDGDGRADVLVGAPGAGARGRLYPLRWQGGAPVLGPALDGPDGPAGTFGGIISP